MLQTVHLSMKYFVENYLAIWFWVFRSYGTKYLVIWFLFIHLSGFGLVTLSRLNRFEFSSLD